MMSNGHVEVLVTTEIRQQPDKFMLRLPDGMRHDLKLRAAANRRSMNSEIVILLEQALAFGPQAAAGEKVGEPDPAAAPNQTALQGG